MKSHQTTIRICRLLLRNRGEILSGGEIARVVSLSRQGVWKNIQALSQEGFSILSMPQKGYILRDLPEYDLAPSLVGAFIPESCPWGREIHVFHSIPSTQETAKGLGRRSGEEGVAVLAEEQTRGRGRRDRSWISIPGSGIFLSIFFRPRLLPGRLQLVNLAAGLAVRRAVQDMLGVTLSLKWPNDLLWNGRKVCGILSEASSDSDRVRDCCTGIGMNVDLSRAEQGCRGLENAAALREAAGPAAGPVHRGCLAAGIISRLFEDVASLERDGGKEILGRYRQECSTLGQEVCVVSDEGTAFGKALGIGENGELLLERDGEVVPYCAADVIHATMGQHSAS